MKFLIDTNVICETFKNRPDNKVKRWFGDVDSSDLYLSVLTLGEIKKGIQMLKRGEQKTKLSQWLDRDLSQWFESRLLVIDKEISDKWGVLSAATKDGLHVVDGLLAATALTHNLAMVTRNIKDFDIPGLSVINPFE